jgi:hypothetical protein
MERVIKWETKHVISLVKMSREKKEKEKATDVTTT